MNVKILGSGCKNCVRLYNNAQEALTSLGAKFTIEKVEDMPSIMKYGVLRTPAVVVDEVVISYGKVLSVSECVEEFKKLI